MRTCIHCGCEVTTEGADAWGSARWVTMSSYGSNRHCGGRNYPTGYHEAAPLVPDLTDAAALREWLV